MKGDTVITGLLLQASTDRDASLLQREAPLMMRVGNAAAVKTLLDHGAQPNTVEGWHSETTLREGYLYRGGASFPERRGQANISRIRTSSPP